MICLWKRPNGSAVAAPSGLIYAHQQNVTVRRTIDDLELIAKVCELDELLNHVVFLPIK
jgi:hypothetical protein